MVLDTIEAHCQLCDRSHDHIVGLLLLLETLRQLGVLRLELLVIWNTSLIISIKHFSVLEAVWLHISPRCLEKQIDRSARTATTPKPS